MILGYLYLNAVVMSRIDLLMEYLGIIVLCLRVLQIFISFLYIEEGKDQLFFILFFVKFDNLVFLLINFSLLHYLTQFGLRHFLTSTSFIYYCY